MQQHDDNSALLLVADISFTGFYEMLFLVFSAAFEKEKFKSFAFLRVVSAAVLVTAFVAFFGQVKLFTARARKAQSSASAAQGRIASGESIASSGLLK